MYTNFFINRINYNNLGYNSYEYFYRSKLLKLNQKSDRNIYILSNGYFPKEIVLVRNKNNFNDYKEIIYNDIDYQFSCSKNRINLSDYIIYFYPYEPFDFIEHDFIFKYLKSKTNKNIKMIINNNLLQKENYLHFDFYRYDFYSERKNYNISYDFNKKFILLNNKYNKIRSDLYDFLMENNDIEKNCYYSFLFKGIDLNKNVFKKDFINISNGETDFFKTHSRFIEDDYLSNNIRNYFEKSFLYIITESKPHLSFNFLTEKTFKSFYHGIPFLLLGPHNSLKYLQKIGFKTFNKWLNENYDSENNIEIRKNMIFNEIKRINNLKTNELEKIKIDMKETLIYNKNIFLNNFNSNFLSFFNNL